VTVAWVMSECRVVQGCAVQGLASPMEYTVIAAFLFAGVARSFAAVILGGYEIARLIAFVL